MHTFSDTTRTADHALMVSSFEAVMSKLATLGQTPSDLVDCSDVIPSPAAITVPSPTLPAGKSLADVQAAVSAYSSRAIRSPCS